MSLRKALLIGINDYPGQLLLKSCVSDVHRVADLLSNNCDMSTNFSCEILASDKEIITKSIIRKKIIQLFRADCDIALLYYSGHASADASGSYLVTPDGKQYDMGVSFDEIISLANKSSAKNILIILDCCYAGAFGKISHINEDYVLLREGISILCSSNSGQMSFEDANGGLFTSLICDALSGKAASSEGTVNIAAIYAYADKLLDPWKQRPVFKANLNTLLSIRKCFNKPEFKAYAGFDDILPKIHELFKSIEVSSIERKNLIKIKSEIENMINSIIGHDKNSKVFISYSHRDKDCLERIQIHLKDLIRQGLIDLWDDTRIISGQNWQVEINNALQSSKIAILLVSADFLASDFIASNELPPLLSKAQQEGVVIIPIIIGYCRFKEDKNLSQFQALNDPKIPIRSMSETEQENIYYKLSVDIEKYLKK